jgi:threonine synthase
MPPSATSEPGSDQLGPDKSGSDQPGSDKPGSDKPGSGKQGSERSLPQATFRFRCIGCGSVNHSAAQDFRCSQCGNLLEITDPAWKSAGLDAAALKSTWRARRSSNAPLDLSGVWRFRELLPAPESEQHVITLREGNTPIYELPQSSRVTGIPRLYAKHQGMNPTGSFKDAGMTVASTFARQAGYRWVACASTGNTSASMAAYAARGGMRSLVLVPEGKISWSKLSQALDYGALTCQLRTDFDGCLRLLQELVRLTPVYQLNSINPFRLEGQKTLALELLEQLDWQPPDHIIAPGGNLGNSSAIGKALLEMLDLGLIPRLPKLSVIQADGANALVRTLREAGGKHLVSVQAETRATAIRIGNPASWEKAVKVLQATGGACEQVSELEIAQAKAEIGAEGIGCEPASAVTLAGLKKLVRQGFVKPEETVVLVLTGNLLKDPDFTMEFHRGDLFHDTAHEHESAKLNPFRHPPVVLDATLDAVTRTLEQAEKSDPMHSNV